MKEKPATTFGGLPRTALITVLLLGAAGSFGLMLYASRRQDSLTLKVLFTGWVLAPFSALIWAYVASKHWASVAQTTLYGLMLVVTAGSLAIYGDLVLGTLQAKSGFIFLVVPAASWLLMAMAFAIAALASGRRQ